MPSSRTRSTTKQPDANSPAIDQAVNCVFCNKTFTSNDDEMCQCELCEEAWVCIKCLKMNNDTFRYIGSRHDFPWLCMPCKTKFNQMKINERQIEQACKEYMSSFEESLRRLEEKVEQKADKSDLLSKADKADLDLKADKACLDETKAMMSVMENKVQGLAKDVSNLNSKLDLVRSESDEKEKRALNIVIRGVPEKEDDSDVRIIQSMLADINCNNIEFDKLSRIGPKPRPEEGAAAQPTEGESEESHGTQNEARMNPKPKFRPIRISLKHVEDKKRILRNATKVRHAHTGLYNPKDIFIVPDYTKLERQQDLELRQRLATRRRQQPEKKWIIRKGKIIEKTEGQ